jgi:hypothetical protein
MYGNVKASTHALVFFGTPHHGGNNASLGKVAANIVTAVSGATTNDIMARLEKNSLLTKSANDYFSYQWKDYRVVTFFETRATKLKGAGALGNYVRSMVVDAESAKVGLPGSQEIQIAVDSDHTNLNKFATRDHLYAPVAAHLRDLVRYCLQHQTQPTVPTARGR